MIITPRSASYQPAAPPFMAWPSAIISVIVKIVGKFIVAHPEVVAQITRCHFILDMQHPLVCSIRAAIHTASVVDKNFRGCSGDVEVVIVSATCAVGPLATSVAPTAYQMQAQITVSASASSISPASSSRTR